MAVRVAIVAVIVLGVAAALWHPVPHAGIVAASPESEVTAAPRRLRRNSSQEQLVVYVAGAVRRPGLYRLSAGDRYDRAVTLAGGFATDADAAGIDLAQRAQDGDEVLVPRAGETTYRRSARSRSLHRSSRHRRRTPAPPVEGSVDVNDASPEELAAVPGIGRAIAARIVELRDREGAFASLDELLDVAGMTQSRLARARAYLREPAGAEGSPH